MKAFIKVRSMMAVLLAMSVIFTVTSCEKEPVDDRPELPPVESMLMDFSDFSEEPGTAKGTMATYANFLHAYLTVGFWNISATLVSALPVTAYGYALQQSPVYLGDYTWEWAFDFPLNNVNYTATLTGARINNEEFSMEMEIALAAAPDNAAKWFDGTVRYDHTHASWTIFNNGTIPVLNIEWNKDFVTEAADLTYTYAESGHAEEGSFIMWDYNPGEEYDAAYIIDLVAGMTNIEWNVTTIKGRVKAPVHFEDSEWHCWDSQANGFMDISCE